MGQKTDVLLYVLPFWATLLLLHLGRRWRPLLTHHSSATQIVQDKSNFMTFNSKYMIVTLLEM